MVMVGGRNHIEPEAVQSATTPAARTVETVQALRSQRETACESDCGDTIVSAGGAPPESVGRARFSSRNCRTSLSTPILAFMIQYQSFIKMLVSRAAKRRIANPTIAFVLVAWTNLVRANAMTTAHA